MRRAFRLCHAFASATKSKHPQRSPSSEHSHHSYMLTRQTTATHHGHCYTPFAMDAAHEPLVLCFGFLFRLARGAHGT